MGNWGSDFVNAFSVGNTIANQNQQMANQQEVINQGKDILGKYIQMPDRDKSGNFIPSIDRLKTILASAPEGYYRPDVVSNVAKVVGDQQAQDFKTTSFSQLQKNIAAIPYGQRNTATVSDLRNSTMLQNGQMPSVNELVASTPNYKTATIDHGAAGTDVYTYDTNAGQQPFANDPMHVNKTQNIKVDTGGQVAFGNMDNGVFNVSGTMDKTVSPDTVYRTQMTVNAAMQKAAQSGNTKLYSYLNGLWSRYNTATKNGDDEAANNILAQIKQIDSVMSSDGSGLGINMAQQASPEIKSAWQKSVLNYAPYQSLQEAIKAKGPEMWQMYVQQYGNTQQAADKFKNDINYILMTNQQGG